MKKNISINIGGIIFHIEEDGFDKLKAYLDNINVYFADFQGSQEIINDIENRIAEIFLQKLKDEKQVINSEDIESLIATLGSVTDFKEAEQDNDPKEESYQTESENDFGKPSSQRLFKDPHRKVFGGVAAGIAKYLKVDPIWIRLALLILTIATFSFGLGVIIAIVYIVLWISLPTDPFAKEEEKFKKLYRGKDGIVIAGVAKGLSAYLGVDVAIIRLLFVITLFLGGSGFLIYLVLWLITPKANSLTDKMQMEGTPITLANIEKSIKSNFKVADGEESVLVRILLFPFRLFALILNGLASVLGPLMNVIVDIVRIVFGIGLVASGLFIGTMAIIFALISNGFLIDSRIIAELDAPLTVITNSIEPHVTIVSLLLFLIPAIFITIAGISVLIKKWVLNKTIGFTMLGIYIISLIAGAIITFNTVLDFNSKATLTETTEFNIAENKTLNLKVKEIGYENYDNPTITLYGYEGNTVKLENNTYSRGYSREDALEKASMLLHEVVEANDSTLVLDSDIRFKDDAIFRGQKLKMKMYIPYGQKFIMSKGMQDLLINTIYKNGYYASQISNNTWVFDENGLTCLTCPEKPIVNNNPSEEINYTDNSFFKIPFGESELAAKKYLSNQDFSDVSVGTSIFMEIIKSEKYSFEVLSEEADITDLEVEQSGDELKVYYDNEGWNWDRQKIKIIIHTPVLESLKASSAAVVHVKGFDQEEIDIDMSSSAKVYLIGDINKIYVDASSASKLFLSGNASKLVIDASSSARIYANQLFAKSVDADASSAARIDVYAADYLSAQASSAGKVTYRGNPSVSSDVSSGGRVKKQ